MIWQTHQNYPSHCNGSKAVAPCFLAWSWETNAQDSFCAGIAQLSGDLSLSCCMWRQVSWSLDHTVQRVPTLILWRRPLCPLAAQCMMSGRICLLMWRPDVSTPECLECGSMEAPREVCCNRTVQKDPSPKSRTQKECLQSLWIKEKTAELLKTWVPHLLGLECLPAEGVLWMCRAWLCEVAKAVLAAVRQGHTWQITGERDYSKLVGAFVACAMWNATELCITYFVTLEITEFSFSDTLH